MIKSASMTKYTREVLQGKKEPQIDMTNRKPRRDAKLRADARGDAQIVKGSYVSTVRTLQGVSANTSR